MKLFLLLALVGLDALAMQRPRSKSETKSKSTNSTQSPLECVSQELVLAIRDLDLPKTQAALKKIESLGKNPEELQCVQTETSTLVAALKFHYEKVSAGVAQYAAQNAVSRFSNPKGKNHEFPCASQAAIFDHGKALAIHDTVINFFTSQWRHQPECLFSFEQENAQKP